MNKAEDLKNTLFSKKENGWVKMTQEQTQDIFSYCNKYIEFLNNSKTERQVIENCIKIAQENGFKEISQYNNLKPGDKVYYINRNKSMYLAIIGKDNLKQGINIIGSHVDSPRLDLKPNPVYEDSGFAYLNTHYYGGIKKYQWATIPLSIYGVIVKPNGEKINICIGDKQEDPVFVITDLLPHLADNQLEKTLKEGITGEDLNILIGNIPYKTNDNNINEKVKLNILDILNKKYGIVESDLLSSELEAVPNFNARSLGLDNSMVGGYGQDDKVCVYTSLTAMMNISEPNKTSICILSDKEEIGSMGNTGMESDVFDNFISILLKLSNQEEINILEHIFNNSKMLSADVDSGFDPIYSNVYEKTNSSYLGHGVGLNKYTGSKGKSGASDANAEYVAQIRKLLEDNNINYQIAELGKVDAGGGGTIAYILANKGIEVIDCGIPVLSMHSPYEVTSKFDIYSLYVFYQAFWNN